MVNNSGTGRLSRIFNSSAALFVFSVLAVLGSPVVDALEPDQIFDKVSPSVVLVLALDKNTVSQGSGVVVAPRRVITNCHVIKKRDRLLVKWGELQLAASLEYADTKQDLCQLFVADLRAPAVEARKLSSVRVGQRVYAIGNPEGLELTLTEGLISGIRTVRERQLIQTSAPFTYGSSGGGLFDTGGRLIGLTTSGIKDGTTLNFAIPADYVFEVSAHARAVAGPEPLSEEAEKTAAKGNAGAFPRVLNATEIAAHFARYTNIEANRDYNPFTLKIHPKNVIERVCSLCRVKSGNGRVRIKEDDGLVCFDWVKVTYPASGCFQMIQTNENSFLIRPLNREFVIMEYSVTPQP